LYIEDIHTVSQKNITPQVSSQVQKKPQTPPGPYHTHTVKKGETLYGIAQMLGTTVENLASWNDKNLDQPIIKPGEKLRYYGSQKSVIHSDSPVTRKGNIIIYKVKKGDNLSSLADLFSTDVSQILKLNDLTSDAIIRPGDLIHIPDVGGKKRPVKKMNTQQLPGRIIYYKVQKGDNLWSIAYLFNVTVDLLYRANNLTKNSVIMPGDTLRIFLPEDS